jgi:hypothetical protein
MHRVDEQGRRRGCLTLAILALSAAALALPAFAAASPVVLEVEKGGIGEGTVTSSPAGITCGATCSAEFEEGKEVTLTASADAESEFIEWEGCDSEPEGKCKVTMNEPRTVSAVFEEKVLPEYTLEINEAGNGEGEWECVVGGEEEFCEEEYPAGTRVTIKTIPYEGSKFSGFSGDCTGTSCTLTMNADHSVTVTFSLREFTLTIKHNGTGEGTWQCELETGPEACLSKYPWETEVTLIAIPKPGSEFAEWKGCDKTPKLGQCEVTFEEARSVTVTFNKTSVVYHVLDVKKEGTGSGTVTSSPAGISCGATCSMKFEEGKEVTLTASASAGSEFVKWEGCASQPEPGKCKVAMSVDRTATATFSATPKPGFTLTVQREGTGSGSVSSDPAGIECGADCAGDYPEGTVVTLRAIPAEGSEFKRWSGVESTCALEPTCRVKMSGSKVVKAAFGSVGAPAPDAEGKVKVAERITLVRGGKALLALRCVGGPCAGKLQLMARIKMGKKRKSLVIGRRSFSFASGAKGTVRVRLSGPAKKEIAKRGRLQAKVTGDGVVDAIAKLMRGK